MRASRVLCGSAEPTAEERKWILQFARLMAKCPPTLSVYACEYSFEVGHNLTPEDIEELNAYVDRFAVLSGEVKVGPNARQRKAIALFPTPRNNLRILD